MAAKQNATVFRTWEMRIGQEGGEGTLRVHLTDGLLETVREHCPDGSLGSLWSLGGSKSRNHIVCGDLKGVTWRHRDSSGHQCTASKERRPTDAQEEHHLSAKTPNEITIPDRKEDLESEFGQVKTKLIGHF